MIKVCQSLHSEKSVCVCVGGGGGGDSIAATCMLNVHAHSLGGRFRIQKQKVW